MPDDAVLDLEARRRVFVRIEAMPGTYLRELQRDLAMPMGMLEYHLGRLEKAGLVTALSGDHKRFYPTRMDAGDKRYLALLRQEGCRNVVLHLLRSPGATHGEMAATLPYRPSTLSFYLGKLVDRGLATRTAQGRLVRYALVDPAKTLGLLVRHRPSFMDRALDGFLEGFEGLGLREGQGEE